MGKKMTLKDIEDWAKAARELGVKIIFGPKAPQPPQPKQEKK
jgi:hypothetical protein